MKKLKYQRINIRIIICLLFGLNIYTAGYSQKIEKETKIIKTKALSEGYNLDVVILKKSEKEKKIPAVLFVVGSGEYSSIETNKDMMHFFFEKTFLLNDFAVVYFDKRGVGNSEGIWYETTFEQRALDAKNVAFELQKLDFIDKEKVFIIGHSQGGWIAQIALALYPEIFAGGVSMAGPTFGVKKQLTNDYMSKFLCDGIEEDRAFTKAKRKSKRDLVFVTLLGWKGNLRQLKIIKDFEPEPYLKGINQPFLMLFAENDPLVSPKWSLEELNKIFPKGLPTNITYHIALGEEHSFKIASRCYKGKWQELDFSERTRDLLFEWVKAFSNKES